MLITVTAMPTISTTTSNTNSMPFTLFSIRITSGTPEVLKMQTFWQKANHYRMSSTPCRYNVLSIFKRKCIMVSRNTKES